MRLLNPNDPEDAFALQDIAQARREARMPKCICCEKPILSETYLDLKNMGGAGYVCESCVENNTYFTADLEDNDG